MRGETKSFQAEALTLIPAIVLFIISIYLAGLSLHVIQNPDGQRLLSTLATSFFFGGIVLAICWVAYWMLHRKL